MVDCSHGNSSKDYTRQPEVAQAICEQVTSGSYNICGVMMESHLVAGRQDHDAGEPLTYGQSITDACIAWDDTIPLLDELATAHAFGFFADRDQDADAAGVTVIAIEPELGRERRVRA